MKKSLLALCFLCVITLINAQKCNPKVGIWYSTWYSNQGHYIWGHTDSGKEKQFLGDMNGDSKADAVLYSKGNWDVALSNGEIFSSPSTWITGHGNGSDEQFLADVNGDGRKDAIVFFRGNGSFYVSLNNGSSLNNYSLWGNNIASTATKVMFADVNNDKKEDIIAFNNGNWDVSISTGSAFNLSSNWLSGHGSGSNWQGVGDVDGDNKADAIVGFTNAGDFYVSTSTGSSFVNGYTKWLSNDLSNKDHYLIQDINNDNLSDLIGFNNSDGRWEKALSTGTSFSKSSFWKINYGNRKRNESTLDVKPFIATIDNSGLPSSIAYVMGLGEWRILPNDSYYSQPNIYNTWEGWSINYIPNVNGKEMQYDSGDTTVIDHHLQMLANAGIDFLLLDLTNNIYVDNGYIATRAKAVAKRIKLWNETNPTHKLYYAVAAGGVQFSGDVSAIEYECKVVFMDFISNEDLGGSSTYYHYNDKPFITMYYGKGANRVAWESYSGSKTYSQLFDFRWANGSKDPNNGDNQFPDVAQYPGWGLPPSGSQINNTLMVAMPGWNNHVGRFVSRYLNNVEGDFYQKNCWDKILSTSPNEVIINSFNEFAEETAIEPCNTNALEGTSEKWSDSHFYWNMTKENLELLLDNNPTANAGVDQTICNGSNIIITASGGINYEWDNNLGTGSSKTVSPNSTTTYLVKVTDANGCSDLDDIKVTVDICTGFQENTTNELSIYPNPSEGIFRIYSELEPTPEWTVFNSLGQELISSHSNSIDLSTTPQGVYLLKVNGKNISLVKQ